MIEFAVIALILIAGFLIREHLFQVERNTWTEERRELLNRIKPETAQYIHSEVETVEPVRTDADYWSAHEDQLKEVGSYPYGFEEEIRGR